MTYINLRDAMLAVLQDGLADQNLMDATGCSQKEADHLLEMAAGQGLIDYGVSARTGWVDFDLRRAILSKGMKD